MVSAGLSPSQADYNLLIPVLVSRNYLNEARHVFDVMTNSGAPLTVHLYRSFIHGFCRKGWPCDAERVLDAMESCGLSPNLRMYTDVMQKYCESGRLDAAVDIFDRMREGRSSSSPGASVYARLIHRLLKGGDFERAWNVFAQMLAGGLEPDESLKFSVIDSHCLKGKVDCACEFLRVMDKCGTEPDWPCYMAVITALYRGNRREEAEGWLDRMLERGLIPDSAVIISLIKFQVMGQEPRLIYKILVAMSNKGCTIDTSIFSNASPEETLKRDAEYMFDMIRRNDAVPADAAFTILVITLCMNGKADLASFFVDKMVSHKYVALVFICNAVIKCLCTARRMDDPRLLIGLMQEWGVVPNLSTYLILIDACCKQGNVDSAIGFLDQMTEKRMKPGVAIYDSIIGCLCTETRLEEAEFIFQNMLDEGLEPDEVAYTTLVNGYCKAERALEAYNRFGMLVEKGFRPGLHAYSALINVLVRRNMFNKACKVFSEMLRKGFLPDTALYTMLLGQFASKGEIGFAFNLYRLMVGEQIEPNLMTLGSLISGACKSIENRGRRRSLLAGKMSKTKSMFLDLLPQRTVAKHYEKETSCMSVQERIREAIDILITINRDKLVLDLHIYNGMINFFCATRSMVDAFRMVDLMLEAGVCPNHVTYTILINGYIRSGEICHALQLFNSMNQLGIRPDEVTYNTVIKGLCMYEEGFAALSLIHMMRKRGFVTTKFSYEKLAELFCLSNHSDIAFKLFEEMLEHDYSPRHKTCNRLLEILIREDKSWEADIIRDVMLRRGRILDQEAPGQLEMLSEQQNST